MANTDIATPRFYISESQHFQSQGNYIDPILQLDTQNEKQYSDFAMNLAFDSYPTYIMMLGIGAGFEVSTDELVTGAILLGEEISVNQEMFLGGFSLIDYPSTNTDIIVTITGSARALSMGRYYDMPQSPELSLVMSHEYDGIKSQSTEGGSTLSYSNFYKAPNWGDLQPWQLEGWSRNYSGRRVWELSFNYISDFDAEPYHYNLNETSGHENWNADGNWFTSVLHYTNGGQLPFVFCPDPSIEYSEEYWTVPEFAICRFDMDTFKKEQVSKGQYNIRIKIKESW